MKYRNPVTGEIVEQPGDGLTEFYVSRGWEVIETIDIGSGLPAMKRNSALGTVELVDGSGSSDWRELLDDEVDEPVAPKKGKAK